MRWPPAPGEGRGEKEGGEGEPGRPLKADGRMDRRTHAACKSQRVREGHTQRHGEAGESERAGGRTRGRLRRRVTDRKTRTPRNTTEGRGGGSESENQG